MSNPNPFAFLDKSAKVGRLFGIPIHLHITLIFFLLPAFANWSLDWQYGFEYAAAIVLCILLHELGHALVAKRYRLTGLKIMLHGFGGFAISQGYRSPRQQLVISLAGPAVTFAIGVVAHYAANWGLAQDLSYPAVIQFTLLDALARLNILLGFLNLLPSLPFDGGHALQAILGFRMPEFRAIRVIGHFGLLPSAVLVIYGLVEAGGFYTIFGLIGIMSSAQILTQTGGFRPKELFEDRRRRKELEAVKRREQERFATFLGNVRSREKDREERERLRKIFESSSED
jgi:Zn-dependent protease